MHDFGFWRLPNGRLWANLSAMVRVGIGFDSHRFAAGRPLVLGGVKINHPRGLAGHSDADAVLHAVADAILGAISAGDIGEHFPPTDERWRNADSAELLAQVVALARRRGWRLGNCDVTIVAQEPHLGAHKPLMRARIAELLALDAGAVSVKAKTNEGMGAIGRGEGIAVMAAVTVEAAQ
jgi:2-C-methyl-D-erythritol 2,4-cyclodiphosphate synthase